MSKDNNTITNFRCKKCNTVFSVHKSLTSSCIHCNERNMEEVDYIKYSDYKMLPFQHTMEDACNKYKSIIRFNPFLPMLFRSKKRIAQMRKVYLPCMLYNANASGTIIFLGTDKIKNIPNVPTQTNEISYQINLDYDNALFSCYHDISDDMMNEINQFNYSLLTDYNEDLIQDSYLIPIEKNISEMQKEIDDKIMNVSMNMVRGMIEHQLKRVYQNNIKIQYKSIQKVFVPIYYLKIKYQNKDYVFIMNDHTEEVYCSFVSSALSIIVSSIILFIMILAILVLFYCVI